MRRYGTALHPQSKMEQPTRSIHLHESQVSFGVFAIILRNADSFTSTDKTTNKQGLQVYIFSKPESSRKYGIDSFMGFNLFI